MQPIQKDTRSDGSEVLVEIPRGTLVNTILVDPGTADLTVRVGNFTFVISAAGGPGPLPLSAPISIDGQRITVQNADGSGSVLFIGDDGCDS